MRMRSGVFLAFILNFQTPNRAEDNPPIRFCELLKNPAAFDSKQVTITAGFRVG